MKWLGRTGAIILSLFLLLPVAASAQQRAQQVTSTGTRSTAIGVVNGNVTLVRGASNATIDKVLKNLQQIKAGGTLSSQELDRLIDVVNDSVIPMLTDIKDDTTSIRRDTEALKAKMDQILELLDVAAEHPKTAPTVLRDFLKPSLDLSNKSYDVSAFLDVNGERDYILTFSLTGDCEIYIAPPEGSGFRVTYGVFSEHQTQIFRALQGTQPRYPPIRVPSGIYIFVMSAKRDAGYYKATISARCR